MRVSSQHFVPWLVSACAEYGRGGHLLDVEDPSPGSLVCDGPSDNWPEDTRDGKDGRDDGDVCCEFGRRDHQRHHQGG